MDSRRSDVDGPVSGRRGFLLAGVATLALAGCLDDGDDLEADGSDDLGEDIPSDQEALIDAWIAEIDGELDVEEWRISGGRFVPRYVSESDPEADIPVLAESYATIVEEGFDYETMPTALDEEGTINYMVIIEREWATEYAEGELERAEYESSIAETIH